MKPRHLLFAAMLAIASLGGSTVTSAHTLVDPTTLTPPLQPFGSATRTAPG